CIRAMRICNACSSCIGFPMQEEHALHIRSLGRKFAIPYLFEIFGPEFDYMKVRSRRMELMAEHIRQYGLEKKPGLEELLSFLQKNRIPAAVTTATDRLRAEGYLQQTGLLQYFSGIICAAMVENGKPAPDIYLFAAQRLGLKPQECMALEDSPNGIRAASSAGCVTVMVPDLTEPDDEVIPLIYTSVETLADVPNIIKQLS
ncbi:MAG: HAD family hydrolase, partial [Oscillospiraceae bacterium]|nr:HAD family hydrolase [Oscillospiraceae bacterium]